MTPASVPGGTGTRCFIALLPNAAGRDTPRHCREALTTANPGIARGVRWVDTAALHLTLRFLGDSSDAQIEYLKHMLPTLTRDLPAIGARRCAIWPNRARPRLLVLELEVPESLLALAREGEALARKAGFAPEPRPFRAHLTLGRLRPGCVPQLPSTPPTPLAFNTLALMASDLQAAGARYRELASVPLNASAKS